MSRIRPVLAVVLSLALCLPPGATASTSGSPSYDASVGNWHIQSSKAVTVDGDQVSRPGFETAGWFPVARRSTIMAGLVQNGRYPDLFHSTNMRDQVDRADFAVPWWYRTEFTVRRPAPHTFLRLPGATARADVWLNGTKLGEVIGSYNAREFDVTGLLRSGRNAMAIRVHPADPRKDFVVSWIDWAQPAPDNNMGFWRDIELVSSGPVSLLGTAVRTRLALPRMDSAEITVVAEVRNNTSAG